MRKQLTVVIDKMISSAPEENPVKSSIITDYIDLNEKCDTVIAKIKARKGKKTPVTPEDK